ncbi:MAG: hypothetical protein ACYTEZ_15165 [Planctomycetota bacterium]|jgi:hypothetical protein
MRWIVSLALLVGTVQADDLYAAQGGRAFARDVMVVEEGADRVVYVDKSLKRRSFPTKIIGRIEKSRSTVHEFVERQEAARTADAVMALAAWAKTEKFHKNVIHSLHERALALDENHEAANLALGRVRHKGAWMTPEERTRRIAEEDAAAKRAQGLVKWKDQWVTPEDKEKLTQGYRKYQGRWMTEDEIKEAQGFVKFKGGWIRKEDLAVQELLAPARKDTGLGKSLRLVQSRHYAILGDLPPEHMNALSKTMERLFAEWVRVFPDAKDSDILEGKHRLYAFRKNRPYQKLVRARFARLKAEGSVSASFLQHEERRVKLRLRETSFWDVQPVIVSGHVQMPDPFEGLRGHCVHFGANILATRHGRLRFPTWWLNEGLAYYFEKKITGAIQTFSSDVAGPRYADQGPGESSKPSPWLDAAKWHNLVLGLVRGGRDTPLDRMKGKNLYDPKNKLTVQDLAKAFTVVTFLIQDDRKKFAAFYLDAKTGSGGSEVEREVAAVIKHYGSYRELDKRWKQYALNGFKISR